MSLTNKQKIAYMMEFTNTFRSCENKDIYEREALCNETQLNLIMLPIEEQDLFAGRKTELPIGFLPQSACGFVGYYCDDRALEELKKDSSLSAGDYENIHYLLDFWKDRTTKNKIFKHYTTEQKELLTHGDLNTETGTAFPLYRMSGAQMNPSKLLDSGIGGLLDYSRQNLARNPEFFKGIQSALLSLQNLCLGYAASALTLARECTDSGRAGELFSLSENLEHIAVNKPRTFWQAAQLSFLFFVVSGTWNYGRMDEYLGSYYARDIDAGIITEEFALRLTKSLWTLIIDRNTTWDGRVILGGKNRKNPEDADRFAMLAMETSRQLKDTLPQLTLRLYEGMDEKLYDKALEIIGEGCTYPILYNDTVNIPAVANAFAVKEATAEDYLPFGCGEYVLYNKSFGTPSGALNLLHGLNTVIYDGEDNLLEASPDFDTFYQAYMSKMEHMILLLAQQEKLEYDICAEEAPYLYYSILFEDCLERGRGVFEGGIRYLGGTLETYGNTNTADSLTAIKMLVYDRKTITPRQLACALKSNFTGYEELRQQLLAVPKYGNDDEIADSMAVRFHNDLCQITRNCIKKVRLHSYLNVIINNAMNTVFGLTTGASADGRKSNTYMANANNPVGGMDKNGVTALFNSLVKLKTDLHAGSVQNMRFTKDMFTRLLPKTKGLLAAYFDKGGSQAMITVLGRKDLENALANPENYQNLIVRVGGFSARFVELSKDIQQELMSRTLY